MTKKGYELIKKILEYGYVNFKGGSGSMDWNEFQARDGYLYDRICEAVNDLDEGEKNND